ncbi:hypothetical protein [Actinomadura sp. GC306]|uniref:hypothetical protein n=1 Tax=Actinomadura sp. GC306 TaxID=2530367 RepID=UPI001FB5EE50|nr:hypothetical protein [Actinomadura sp. GC306]
MIRNVAPRIASKIKSGGGKGGTPSKGNPVAKAKPVSLTKPKTASKPATKAAAAGSTMCSFVSGTAVLMADGTRKPIDKLKVGDNVLATDPDTGKTAPQTVLCGQALHGLPTRPQPNRRHRPHLLRPHSQHPSPRPQLR